jgi:hypothetical protein
MIILDYADSLVRGGFQEDHLLAPARRKLSNRSGGSYKRSGLSRNPDHRTHRFDKAFRLPEFGIRRIRRQGQNLVLMPAKARLPS